MRRIVIGIGNPERGDDAAGRIVARRLRGALPQDIEIVEHDGEATGLLALLGGADAAFLIDACLSDASPGSIHCCDLAKGPLPPSASPVSSHGLGVAEALELARALGRLPRLCIVYAIEGQRFEVGASLSAAVTAAIAKVVRRLRTELAEAGEATCTKPR
jgi:hydrogenase maturation protease